MKAIPTWKQRKLTNLVSVIKSYPLSRSVETEKNTGVRYIHYGDIHTKRADKITSKSNIPNINVGDYKYLEKDDLALADASEDYQGIAMPSVIVEKTPFRIVAGLHTIALRPKTIEPLYLYYLIHSSTFRKYGYKVGTGMKVFGISKNNILKFETLFPCIEEQTKISSLLNKIDDTIALHQRKFEQLREFKRAALQSLFPQKNETEPKVRFANFSSSWKQRKLGDLGKLTSGIGFPNIEQGGSHGVPFFKISDMNNNGNEQEMITANNYVAHEQIYRNNWQPINEVPAIIFSKVGAAISLNRKRLVRYPFLIDNNTMAYSFDDTWSIEFGKAIFETIYLPKYAQIGALPSYNNSDIASVTVHIPDNKEQIHIGHLFNQIEHAIACHQKKLEKLQTLKKAFLQKMFI